MAGYSADELFSDSPNRPSSSPAPSKSDGYSAEDLFGSSATQPKEIASKGDDKTSTQTLSDLVTGNKPPKTSAIGTFARESGLAVPSTAIAIGVGEAATTASAPFVGFAAPVVGIVAGGAAGFAASYLGEAGLDKLEHSDPLVGKFFSLLGIDKATREAGRKEHEYAALTGQLASGGPFVSTAAKSIAQRAVSGAIQAGIGAGNRAAFGEEQDLKKTALEFVGGATLAGSLTKAGERIPGTTKSPKGTTPPRDKRTAELTPAEKIAFTAKTEETNERKHAESPLVETAIRNKKTGDIERMGPKHDEKRKAEVKDDPNYEEGFVNERGRFYNRKEAVEHAKGTGQIPKDHVLDIPEEGLHSGDLRKAGDERFKITEEQPAGQPKPPEQEKPVLSRREHYDKIDDVQHEMDMATARMFEAEQQGNHVEQAAAKTQLEQLQKEHDDLKASIPETKFADPTDPTWEELQDHLYKVKNLGEALDRVISNNTLGTPMLRTLAKALNSSDFIRSAEMEFLQDFITVTRPDGSTVVSRATYTGGTAHKVRMGKDASLKTLLHEATHAGTQKLLLKGDSAAAKKMQELYDKYEAQVVENLKQQHPNEWKKAEDSVTKGLITPLEAKELFLKNINDFNNRVYGLTNVHEFVSEAFSNTEFQKLLSGINTGKKPGNILGTLWGDFKEAVRQSLGLDPRTRTALSEVLDGGISLVSKSKNFKKSGGVVVNPASASGERRPVTLDDNTPPKYLYHGTRAKPEIDAQGNLILKPSKNFGGKTSSVSLTHDPSIADHYSTWRKGGGPDGFSFSGAKTIKLHSDALPEGISRESGEEWAFNTDKPVVIPKGKYEVIEHPLAQEGSRISHKDFMDWLEDSYSDYEIESMIGEGKEGSLRKSFLEEVVDGGPENWGKEYVSKAKAELDAIAKQSEHMRSRSAGTYKEPSVEWNASNKVSSEIVPLDSKRNGIFEKNKVTREAWLQMGMHEFAQEVTENFHIRSREEARREVMEKYLTQKDILEAARIDKEQGTKNFDPKRPDAWQKGRQVINNILDARSGGKWQEEMHAIMEKKPSFDERVWEWGQEEGLVYDNRTKGEKARDELSARGRLKEAAEATDAQLEEKAASYADGERHGLAADAYHGTLEEGGSRKEAQAAADDVMNDDEYRTELFDKELERLKGERDKARKELKRSGNTESPTSAEEAFEEKTSKDTAEGAKTVDVRTIPNKKSFYEHAADIYDKYGEEAALKFFADYKKELFERSIPIPSNEQELDDAFHMVETFRVKDQSEHVVGYKESKQRFLEKYMGKQRPGMFSFKGRKEWDAQADKAWDDLQAAAFFDREEGKEVTGPIGETLKAIDEENLALVRKIEALGGDIGEEFKSGQGRIRVFGGVTSNVKKTIAEFFANRMPMSEKVGEQVNAAKERTVFQMDDGRVVELHRQPEDATIRYKEGKRWVTREISKGTEIYEWKNGEFFKIGHSDDPNFKLGDSVEITEKVNEGGVEREVTSNLTLVDGKVPDIETHSPYRYLHDAEASARMKNMELRRMARDLELIENLKQSKLFEAVGFSPERPIKELPKGWVVPNNLDKIPELRGWHFDPKTAAIIEDFAKVWDNNLWMKLSNQIVKNMMLNPIPHMFNEVMHLWNARGFTGWLPGTGGLSRFKETSRIAWNDVMNQTQFYRDIMREGGSILGATPRNNYFDKMLIEHGKILIEDKEVKTVLQRLGKNTLLPLAQGYNALSRFSQKAMWVTRDVMYVQYVREIMKQHPELDLKGAVEHAERHMPNYRMPSEVLGSRQIAKVLKNPNIAMFSRYHYGMVKSLVNTIRDVLGDPRLVRKFSDEAGKHKLSVEFRGSKENFKEGLNSMFAIGVAMSVMYPLMDKLAQLLTKDDTAEQRRAGPYHLIKAGADVAEGKKDASALIWPVFTFNPMLLGLIELASNHKLTTGKPIYHPSDPAKDIAGDVLSYGAKMAPQYGPMKSAIEDEGGGTNFLAKQVDIKAQTPEQKARIERAKKRQAIADKTRAKQREHGTYKP